MNGRAWASVHAYHHGDLDVLLLDGVRPLLDWLLRRRLIDACFFLRYWDGGPHLRLRLRSTVDPAGVERLALSWLRRYLATNPAQAWSGLRRYPEYAAQLARREGVTDYLREPLPNNTVLAVPYRPETDRYGDGESLAAVERHFAESSRIALGLIAARATREQRHTAALSAVLLGWLASGQTPPAGPPDPGVDVERLRTLARRVVEIADGTTNLPASGALTSWWRTITTVPRDVVDLCAHLLCNRLGLTITEEQQIRRLAARAAADPLVGAP